jgi:hypothetical protein
MQHVGSTAESAQPVFVAQGCDDTGIEMLRNKEIDGDLRLPRGGS